jgi:hypothetical protein
MLKPDLSSNHAWVVMIPCTATVTFPLFGPVILPFFPIFPWLALTATPTNSLFSLLISFVTVMQLSVDLADASLNTRSFRYISELLFTTTCTGLAADVSEWVGVNIWSHNFPPYISHHTTSASNDANPYYYSHVHGRQQKLSTSP